MKETLIKELLKILSKESTAKAPLDGSLSARLALHLQTFRYMLATYGDKSKVLSKETCPESFVKYLKAAKRASNDVYSWSKDDKKFLKNVAFRPMYFEKTSDIFHKMEKALSGLPEFVKARLLVTSE